MKRTILKTICLLLLILILGFGLPFGSAYVYGRIRYAEKRATVVSLLDTHENELLEIVNGNATDAVIIGFEKIIQEKNNCFFQLPYVAKLGGWVPCGLLYNNDSSAIEQWQKTSYIRGNWYFYWEP